MVADVHISFHGVDASPATEAYVRQRMAELGQFSDCISAGRVVIERMGRQHHQGSLFRIGIDLTLPQGHVVVSRDPGRNHAHEDLRVALHDAFDAARRRLQDHMRQMEGATKTHARMPAGWIVRIFPDKGYAFVNGDDDAEVYVHRNAVREGRFEDLKVGDRVRYVLSIDGGNDGPQASAVFPARE